MNWKKFRFTFAFILLLITFILALPQFSFNIGGNKISFPSIDFSRIDSKSTVGNLVRSRGLYPTKEVKSTLNFGTADLSEYGKKVILEDSLNRVRSRISLSGLYDVEARSEINGENYTIILSYPDYYINPVKFNGWLTGRGVITLESFSSDGSTGPLELSDKDIKGAITLNFISGIGSHLQFQFDSTKATELKAALTPTGENQVGFFFMDVDGREQFFVRQYEQNDTAYNVARAIPTSYTDESAEKKSMLSIVRTYFAEAKPLDYGFTSEEVPTIIPNEFSPEGTRAITLMAMLGILALTIFIIIKYKFVTGMKYLLMIGSVITFTLTIMKYTNAPLSIGSLIGFVILIMCSSIIILYILLEKDYDLLVQKYSTLTSLSIASIFINIMASALIKNVWLFYDLSGVILIGSIVLFIMTVFNFRALNELEFNRKTI